MSISIDGSKKGGIAAMPINRLLYPDNWEEISFVVRAVRAKWRCEWCGAAQGEPNPVTGSKVVLTVAHLGIAKPDGTPCRKEDKQDCRPENIAALCQRCHLNFDRPEILATQAANRSRKSQEQQAVAIGLGQQVLWSDES